MCLLVSSLFLFKKKATVRLKEAFFLLAAFAVGAEHVSFLQTGPKKCRVQSSRERVREHEREWGERTTAYILVTRVQRGRAHS